MNKQGGIFLERFIPTPFSDPADNTFIRLCGTNGENCGTGNGSAGSAGGVSGTIPLDELPLAMAYVPRQTWKTTYPVEEALVRGTIFPELDLPFTGRRGDTD